MDYPHPEVLTSGIIYMTTRLWTPLYLQFSGEVGRSFPISHGYDEDDWKRSMHMRRLFPTMRSPDWLTFYINGTTFSGHPTRTTLGNTLRSLVYHAYMLHRANIDNYFLAAAGDDVVCWVEALDAHRYAASIRRLTSSDPDTPAKLGIGQCIKEIKISQWWDIDFCSKICELTDTWALYRDAAKCWRQKMIYTGPLEQFHCEPERHVISLALNAEAEISCALLREFYIHRLQTIKTQCLAEALTRRAHRISHAIDLLSSPKRRKIANIRDDPNPDPQDQDIWRDHRAHNESTRRFRWEHEHTEVSYDQSLRFLKLAGWSAQTALDVAHGYQNATLH